ncbi:TadE family protein [Candidatus Oscillochloris fontis]|uniref:TadE family protein n=1 Tax=Candidatus Oscillochloris fontis TaxID=2496868 RepID=UPI00101CA5B5|nr:TadE family protein [Candidatus Oscillochloris fontis]
MWRRANGQSIVEMAFVLPILLVVLFGIMEFGYIIFAYSTVSQAARNAAEAAAQLPPQQSWLAYRNDPSPPVNYPGFRGDACVRAVYQAAESDDTIFPGISNGLIISYPMDDPDGDGEIDRNTRNLTDRGPVEVSITYQVRGITPLFNLFDFGNNGTITLAVTQRRSIESLGRDPTKTSGIACARDVAEWRTINEED